MCVINQYTVCNKTKLPVFLDNYPDIKEAITTFYNINILNLASYSFKSRSPIHFSHNFLKNSLKNNLQLGMNFIKKENCIKAVCKQIIA